MSVTTFIARRFMQAGRTNRFFSWISILTISGVAIGVAAMIVVWSVINGFETELRKRFLAANAHVMAYRFPHGLTNYQQWAETVRNDFEDDVTGVSPFVHYETMGRVDSIMHAMLIRGIDLPPSQFEALFVNLAHGEAEIEATVKAYYEALQACIR